MNLLSRVFPSPSAFLSCLGIRWAPPAHNQPVLRCGALCLALNDQRHLCSQAWGQWLGGSVARTLWPLRKHMRLCLRRPGPVSQSPSLLPFLPHRWVPLGLLLSSAKDTAVTREGAGGRKGEGQG